MLAHAADRPFHAGIVGEGFAGDARERLFDFLAVGRFHRHLPIDDTQSRRRSRRTRRAPRDRYADPRPNEEACHERHDNEHCSHDGDPDHREREKEPENREHRQHEEEAQSRAHQRGNTFARRSRLSLGHTSEHL